MFTPKQIQKEFPIYHYHPSLVYLDSAATSLKPLSVIEKLEEYYKKYSANIHRGIYSLAEKASEEYEETRKILALFLGTKDPREVIFTKGTTEGINLLAHTLAEQMNEGDEIVTTIMEHHANFVPWQQLVHRSGAVLKVIDINNSYELGIVKSEVKGKKEKGRDIDLTGIVTSQTKILAINYVSNALGTINPVKEIIHAAKSINPEIITIVDAAQAAPHMKIDVVDLGCDFLVFSGHKMLGPTGVGVLWGRYELLDTMPPYQTGGDMIREVTLEKTTFADVPHRFEAGTPPIAEVIALKESIAQLEYFGFENIHKHEMILSQLAREKLLHEFNDEITIYGPENPQHRSGIVTFTLKGIHPHDIAQILDEDDICIRAGHHCTMPLHDSLSLPATARASFYLYNTEEDVERFVEGLKKAATILIRN